MMIPYTYYELEEKLNELRDGRCVVVPANIEHARFMLQVAQAYINQDKQEMINSLQKEY